MPQKARYQTKQMAELLTYLKSVKGSHVTVHDICTYFESRGITVGMTTVYRNLERMVQEGIAAKYTVEGSPSACFEYIEDRGPCAEPSCYHCKCEKCGKLIHLQCSELGGIDRHLSSDHGFKMDTMRTVFYGICAQCQEAERLEGAGDE